MEISVRYVPTERAVVNGVPILTGNKPALCFRGEDSAHAIINDELTISMHELSLEAHDGSKKVPYQELDYPPSRFLDHLLRIDKPLEDGVAGFLQFLTDGKPVELPSPVRKLADKPKKKKEAAAPKSTLIRDIAAEMKQPPTAIRKHLRSAGLRAPYEDEKQIRAALKTFGKEEKKDVKKKRPTKRRKGRKQ